MSTDKLIAAAYGRPDPTTEPRRDRAFIALPVLGLGLEFLAWSGAARHLGPLVPGALLTGFGSAVLLVAGPLIGSGPGVIGGTVLAGFAPGWVASLSRIWWIGPTLIASIAAWVLLSGRAR